METDLATMGTKAPYYGNIAVAAMLGNLRTTAVTIASIALPSDGEAAYAAYTGQGTTKSLRRVLVLNMQSYNTTVDGAGLVPLAGAAAAARGSKTYSFGGLPAGAQVAIQRLMANGSDAITGITWDGWSYNYELDGGRPVRQANVTVGEAVVVGTDGSVNVTVPDSSAAILTIRTPCPKRSKREVSF